MNLWKTLLLNGELGNVKFETKDLLSGWEKMNSQQQGRVKGHTTAAACELEEPAKVRTRQSLSKCSVCPPLQCKLLLEIHFYFIEMQLHRDNYAKCSQEQFWNTVL